MTEPTNDTHETLPAPRRHLWKTVTMSAVLVLCGMIIGSGLTVMAINRRIDEFRGRPDLMSQRMVERMETDLELTEAQTEEIRKIFGDARREAGQMRERSRAQAQAFFRDFQGKVSQVLTPSQQAEWEEWFRKARSRAMKDRHDGSRDDNKERNGEHRGPGRDGTFQYDGLMRPRLDEPRLEAPPAGDPPPRRSDGLPHRRQSDVAPPAPPNP